MLEKVGNFEKIFDCNALVELCKKADGKKLDSSVMKSIQNTHSEKIVSYYNDLFITWENCGYDLSSFEWYNYYPDIDYPSSITKNFGDIFGLIPKRDWISEIKPGKTAPYHWDIDDKHSDWQQEGNLVRYSVFIGKPTFGHTLCFDNESFYKIEQGSVILWNHYLDYHGAANCGAESFYLYHCLGIRK